MTAKLEEKNYLNKEVRKYSSSPFVEQFPVVPVIFLLPWIFIFCYT